jgi:hypothetical protein
MAASKPNVRRAGKGGDGLDPGIRARGMQVHELTD